MPNVRLPEPVESDDGPDFATLLGAMLAITGAALGALGMFIDCDALVWLGMTYQLGGAYYLHPSPRRR